MRSHLFFAIFSVLSLQWSGLRAGYGAFCRKVHFMPEFPGGHHASIPQGGGKELRNRIGVGSLGLKGWRSVGTPQIVGVSGVRKLSQRISRQIQNEQGLNLREKPFGPQHFNPSQLCAESVKYVEARYECYCREL